MNCATKLPLEYIKCSIIKIRFSLIIENYSVVFFPLSIFLFVFILVDFGCSIFVLEKFHKNSWITKSSLFYVRYLTSGLKEYIEKSILTRSLSNITDHISTDHIYPFRIILFDSQNLAMTKQNFYKTRALLNFKISQISNNLFYSNFHK